MNAADEQELQAALRSLGIMIDGLKSEITTTKRERDAATAELSRLSILLASRGLSLHAPFRVMCKRGVTMENGAPDMSFTASIIRAVMLRAVWPEVDVVGADGRVIVEFGRLAHPAQHLVDELKTLRSRVVALEIENANLRRGEAA